MGPRVWVTQREAALHFRISERTLIRLRTDGTLSSGICWIRKVPTNRNSHVIYDLEACDHAMSAHTAAAAIEQVCLRRAVIEQVN